MSDVAPAPQSASSPQPGESDADRAARTGGANLLAYLAHAASPVFHASIANLFGAGLYGLYMTSLSMLELITRTAMCGAEIGLLRFVAMHRSKGEVREVDAAAGTALRTSFVVGAVFTVALVLLAEPVARFYGEPEVGAMLQRIAAAIPFSACMILLVAATLAAQVATVNLWLRGVGEPLLMLALALAFAAVMPDATGLALAHLTTAVLVCAGALYAYRRVFGAGRVLAALRAPRHGRLLRFSLPMSVAELLNLLLQRADLLILLYFVGKEQLGIYAGAEFIARSVANARYAFDYVACPVMAEAHSAGDRPRLRYNLQLMTRWVSLLALPLLLVLLALRTEVLSIFGAEFAAAAGPFVVLVAAHFANAMLGLTGWVVAMAGHTRLMVGNALLGAAVNIGLNLWLIPRYGLDGAAWAAFASLLVFRGLEVAEAWVLERAHAFTWSLARALLAGGAGLGAALGTRAALEPLALWSVLCVGAVGLAVYFVALVLLRPAAEERRLLAKVPFLRAWLRR